MLSMVPPLSQKCATAEVDDPDSWDIRAGLNENVFQLDVIVKHTLGVDLNEGVHQLPGQDLTERERHVCDMVDMDTLSHIAVRHLLKPNSHSGQTVRLQFLRPSRDAMRPKKTFLIHLHGERNICNFMDTFF